MGIRAALFGCVWWAVLCGSLPAHGAWLRAGDVRAVELGVQWSSLRKMLATGPHGKRFEALWSDARRYQTSFVLVQPMAMFLPTWLADARDGKVVLNTLRVGSLRRQFNRALARQKRIYRGQGELDLTGAWTGVWQGLSQAQFASSRLKQSFALKLYLGFFAALTRAVLQARSRAKVGFLLPDQSFEESLVVLAMQRRLLEAIWAHPTTRALWRSVYWRRVERSMWRLLGRDEAGYRALLKQKRLPSYATAIARKALVHRAMDVLRREICMFCPVYSLLPTKDVLDIQLTSKDPRFRLNRDRYRSPLWEDIADLKAHYRADLRLGGQYVRAFYRGVRAKGPRYWSHRHVLIRNLMIRQVQAQNRRSRSILRWLHRPRRVASWRRWMRATLRAELGIAPRRIKALVRRREELWLRRGARLLNP